VYIKILPNKITVTEKRSTVMWTLPQIMTSIDRYTYLFTH